MTRCALVVSTPKDNEKKPQCWQKITGDDGARRQCTKPGVWVYVVGSFGRNAQILCHKCIERVRAMGWKVTYMIEGDKPTQVDAVSDSPVDSTGETTEA